MGFDTFNLKQKNSKQNYFFVWHNLELNILTIRAWLYCENFLIQVQVLTDK